MTNPAASRAPRTLAQQAHVERLQTLARDPAWRAFVDARRWTDAAREQQRQRTTAQWRRGAWRARVRDRMRACWADPAWRERWQASRRATSERRRLTFCELFARYVRPSPDPDGCWIWEGPCESTGYGRVRLLTSTAKIGAAHRVVYEHLIGPIPDGMHLHHRCETKRCVRPAHLEVVPPEVHAAYTFQKRHYDEVDSAAPPVVPSEAPEWLCGLCGVTNAAGRPCELCGGATA